MAKRQSEVKISFEDRLARLQEIVAALEEGSVGLEESLLLYKEGQEHTKACREELTKARHEVEILTEKGPEPFTPADEEDIPF